MMYHYFSATHTGRVRTNNEDSVVFDEATHIAVLADGMGGYNAGEIASGMATAFIQSELSRWLSEAGELATSNEVRLAMEICANNANRSILGAAKTNPSYAGMGTTLVMGIFRPESVVVGHIGDSRCYRMRDGIFEQITKDHSLLQEQIDAGLVTLEDAAHSPIKNLVTRALGVEEVALLEVNEHSVQKGDIFLMCSDGLSDMVEDAAIAKIIAEGSVPEQIAQELVNAANKNGGRDNISVLLVQAVDLTEKRSLFARLLGK
jgi:protein phosphatase